VRSGPYGPVGDESSGPYSERWNQLFSPRGYKFDKYRTDEWHDEKPSRVPRSLRLLVRVLVVVVVVGGSILAVNHYANESVGTLNLGSDEVHIDSCTTDGWWNGSIGADFVNPTGHTANLGAQVEFDDPTRYPSAFGSFYVVVKKVPGHKTALVSTTQFIDTSAYQPLAPEDIPTKVTCTIIGEDSVPLSK